MEIDCVRCSLSPCTITSLIFSFTFCLLLSRLAISRQLKTVWSMLHKCALHILQGGPLPPQLFQANDLFLERFYTQFPKCPLVLLKDRKHPRRNLQQIHVTLYIITVFIDWNIINKAFFPTYTVFLCHIVNSAILNHCPFVGNLNSEVNVTRDHLEWYWCRAKNTFLILSYCDAYIY